MTAIITCPYNTLMETCICLMLRHFTIARILKFHVSVGNRGLSDVGTFFNVKFLSQEICGRCWDMSEVGVSVDEV